MIEKSASNLAAVIVQDVFDFTMKALLSRYEMDRFGEKEASALRDQIATILKTVDPQMAKFLKSPEMDPALIKKFMMGGKELIDKVLIAHTLPEISDDDISMFYDYEDPDMNVAADVNELIERAQLAAVDKKHLN